MSTLEKVKATSLIFLVAGILCSLHAPIILLLAFVIVLFGIGMQEVKKEEDKKIREWKDKQNNIEKR